MRLETKSRRFGQRRRGQPLPRGGHKGKQYQRVSLSSASGPKGRDMAQPLEISGDATVHSRGRLRDRHPFPTVTDTETHVRRGSSKSAALFGPRVSSLKVLRDTLQFSLSMSSVAARQFESRDRRDTMILAMATDAARVKVKAREAKHKKTRQIGYRAVRYQRFKGRRHEIMEDETREALQAPRAKRCQAMVIWLEAQAMVNAQEGKPRDEPRNPVLVDSHPELSCSGADNVSSEEPQGLITTFFRSVRGGR